MKKVIVYSDGASRGNPGRAASAFLIKNQEGKIVKAGARLIGTATNNVAEYTALIDGLMQAAKLTSGEAACYSDSKLMVNQLRGGYRTKNPQLKRLFQKVRNLEDLFSKVTYVHVPRSSPDIKKVDRMVNEVLDRAREKR